LTGEECEFDEQMRVNQRPGTSGGIGGYNEGAKLFDNTSWATENNHHTD
jgi:hypothetical protein